MNKVNKPVKFLLLASVISLTLSGCFGPPSEEQIAKKTADTASICAKWKVKEMLSSPSEADFPSIARSTSILQPDGTHLVTSYVDAQNLFGATLRTDYKCIVKVTDEENFQCESTCELLE